MIFMQVANGPGRAVLVLVILVPHFSSAMLQDQSRRSSWTLSAAKVFCSASHCLPQFHQCVGAVWQLSLHLVARPALVEKSETYKNSQSRSQENLLVLLPSEKLKGIE